MTYGAIPKLLGVHAVAVSEMMFYQYLPIKFPGQAEPIFEERLEPFSKLIGICCCDFIGVYGLNRYMGSYVYLSAKHLYQSPERPFNRPGYHADGFMTEDINYLWSDKNPTIFNRGPFVLSEDDTESMREMETQANIEAEWSAPENSLLRLDQFNIHKPAHTGEAGLRAFMKLSFSRDKYDLCGNSHNYRLEYKWEMKPRRDARNIPQSTPTHPESEAP